MNIDLKIEKHSVPWKAETNPQLVIEQIIPGICNTRRNIEFSSLTYYYVDAKLTAVFYSIFRIFLIKYLLLHNNNQQFPFDQEACELPGS